MSKVLGNPFVCGTFFGGIFFGLWLVWGFWGPTPYFGIWEGWHSTVTKTFFPLLDFYLNHTDISYNIPSPFDVMVGWSMAILPYPLLAYLFSTLRKVL